MLSRIRWLRILVKRRYKKVLGMEPDHSLFASIKRCFFIGLGIGTGVVLSVYVARKLSQQNDSRELVLAVNQVTNEIRDLRISMVQHFERTASAFSNEQVLTKGKLFRRPGIRSEVTGESEALYQGESSSDDDFYDLLEEDEQVNNSESLQERSILNVDEMIKKCDILSENNNVIDNEKEITILLDLLERNPDNAEVLWRCARAYKLKADFCGLDGNSAGRREAIFKGLENGDRAVEISEEHASTQKWCAILLGMATEIAPFTEQIPMVYRFKKHALKAIELNPEDSTNYHLLGRWCFEVSNISWWQRQAAATLLGDPPMSNFEEALSYLEQVEKLTPGLFKYNSLLIAKCHQKLGDMDKSREWLQKTLEIQVKDYEDQKAHEEATAIMQSL